VALISVSLALIQPDTSRSRKTKDTGLLHRVVCPFTPSFRYSTGAANTGREV